MDLELLAKPAAADVAQPAARQSWRGLRQVRRFEEACAVSKLVAWRLTSCS
jgi:hypothetical protein